MVVIRTFLTMLLCTVSAFAGDVAVAKAEARIDGPKEGEAGDMVILDSGQSKGDASTWIIPEGLPHAKADHRVMFATRVPGKYTFHLIVVDIEQGDDGPTIDIATQMHTYTNKGAICEEPGEPTDPDEPSEPGEPPSDPDTSRIEKVSKDAAVSLNDPETARSLAEVVEALVGAANTVEELRELTTVAIEGVFLQRDGDSRTKDWLNQWRRPVNAVMDTTSIERYNASLKAVARGLRASIGSAPQPPPVDKTRRIIMETRDNCGWCQRWKKEIEPLVKGMGFAVEHKESSGAVPAFTVIVNGKQHRLTGFQPESSFEQFVASLMSIL